MLRQLALHLRSSSFHHLIATQCLVFAWYKRLTWIKLYNIIMISSMCDYNKKYAMQNFWRRWIRSLKPFQISGHLEIISIRRTKRKCNLNPLNQLVEIANTNDIYFEEIKGKRVFCFFGEMNFKSSHPGISQAYKDTVLIP